ncbi:MAG: glycosyltransferase family 4 protein [bacterium]|nr:glycosyltransferase family 4 protein [Candidatus Sumerlaeota bacterium]
MSAKGRPVKALFLVHNLPFRGSYFRALEIARRMALRGHYVEFVHISEHKKRRPSTYSLSIEQGNSPGDILKTALTVVESPNQTFFNDRQEGWGIFDNGFRIHHALRQRWDLVYGFSHKPDCVLPALAAKARGAKMILDWSDWWGGREGLYQMCVLSSDGFRSLPLPLRTVRRVVFAAEAVWEPHACRIADAVTLISGEFMSHPRAPASLARKAFVMHSGAPLDRIRPMPKDEARAALNFAAHGIASDSIVLGYIANFHTDERLLLEAVASAISTGLDLHFIVAGADFERFAPALHDRLMGRAHHFGRIPFEHIGHFLGAADILLLPLSDVALNRARYPHKLSDYAAAGRPIIACDVGETGRLLRRYDFGLPVKADPPAFAGGIIQLAARRGEWEAIGARTRRTAEECFNWDKLCAGLFDFLRERLALKSL